MSGDVTSDASIEDGEVAFRSDTTSPRLFVPTPAAKERVLEMSKDTRVMRIVQDISSKCEKESVEDKLTVSMNRYLESRDKNGDSESLMELEGCLELLRKTCVQKYTGRDARVDSVLTANCITLCHIIDVAKGIRTSEDIVNERVEPFPFNRAVVQYNISDRAGYFLAEIIYLHLLVDDDYSAMHWAEAPPLGAVSGVFLSPTPPKPPASYDSDSDDVKYVVNHPNNLNGDVSPLFAPTDQARQRVLKMMEEEATTDRLIDVREAVREAGCEDELRRMVSYYVDMRKRLGDSVSLIYLDMCVEALQSECNDKPTRRDHRVDNALRKFNVSRHKIIEVARGLSTALLVVNIDGMLTIIQQLIELNVYDRACVFLANVNYLLELVGEDFTEMRWAAPAPSTFRNKVKQLFLGKGIPPLNTCIPDKDSDYDYLQYHPVKNPQEKAIPLTKPPAKRMRAKTLVCTEALVSEGESSEWEDDSDDIKNSGNYFSFDFVRTKPIHEWCRQGRKGHVRNYLCVGMIHTEPESEWNNSKVKTAAIYATSDDDESEDEAVRDRDDDSNYDPSADKKKPRKRTRVAHREAKKPKRVATKKTPKH